MTDKPSHSRLHRTVSRTVNRVWNEPARRIKSAIRCKITVLRQYGPRACWARYRYLLLTRFISASNAASSPQFHSGGKLVSVLLPSRGRPHGLLHAVSSLIARCDNPGSIEILLRLDDDDTASQNAAECLKNTLGDIVTIRAIVGPRGDGYRALHEFVEELCAIAHGDFLLLFNDDMVVDTEKWDAKIARYRDRFCVLRLVSPMPLHISHLNPFPAVHRKVHEVIGHFSKSGFCDTWMQEISRRAGIERTCPVQVTHRQKYYEASTDVTAKEALGAMDVLYRQFYSPEQKKSRHIDLAKINAHIDRFGIKLQRIEDTS